MVAVNVLCPFLKMPWVWSAMGNCGIFWPHSLIFCDIIDYMIVSFIELKLFYSRVCVSDIVIDIKLNCLLIASVLNGS